MIKQTLFAAAAAMVMCSAVAQDGTYHDNVNKNMQDNNMQNKMHDKSMQNTTMTSSGMYSMRTYDDLNNWTDHSTWMTDVWMSVNARDAAVLQQALWRLPSAEEKAVRKALQKCTIGSDEMFTKLREHHSMMQQGATTSAGMNNRFTMSDRDVWAGAMTGLTTYEQRQLDWVWEHMLPSERDALMNAFRACHERHYTGMRGSISR